MALVPSSIAAGHARAAPRRPYPCAPVGSGAAVVGRPAVPRDHAPGATRTRRGRGQRHATAGDGPMTEPVLVGIIDDGVGSRDAKASGDNKVHYHQLEMDMRLAVDRVAAAGRLDRDIAFVHAEGIGLPSGTAFAV